MWMFDLLVVLCALTFFLLAPALAVGIFVVLVQVLAEAPLAALEEFKLAAAPFARSSCSRFLLTGLLKVHSHHPLRPPRC